MAKNNRMIEEIDEAAMLRSIYERDNPPATPVQKPQEEMQEPQASPEPAIEPEQPESLKEAKEKDTKEPARRKKANNADYSSLFLGRNELKARSCVYISQRIHAAISEIVQVIADKDVTVGGYIDSILSEHLETHKEEIFEMYDRELAKKNSNNLKNLIR